MASVLDVAAYILAKPGPITAMKLQKLAYYSQAWALVWNEKPIFPEKFKAWANGPVSPMLHFHPRGKFTVAPGEISGDPDRLTDDERKIVDSVLGFYASKDL